MAFLLKSLIKDLWQSSRRWRRRLRRLYFIWESYSHLDLFSVISVGVRPGSAFNSNQKYHNLVVVVHRSSFFQNLLFQSVMWPNGFCVGQRFVVLGKDILLLKCMVLSTFMNNRGLTSCQASTLIPTQTSVLFILWALFLNHAVPSDGVYFV